MLVLARSTRKVLTADTPWWMLRSFAFLFARCPCVCVPVCLRDHHKTKKKKNEDLKHDKTKNKKNASKSQMVKNLKREREKIKDLTRDPYFCPCDPDHVCQLSITFAWRVIHCWMEQLFFFFSRLFLFIILIRFIFRQFCLSIALFCFPLSLSLAFVLLHLTFRSPSPLAYRHSYRHSSIPNHNQPVHFIDKVFDACARLYLSVDCSPLDFHWDRLLLFVANVLSIVIANPIEISRKLIITGTRPSKKKSAKGMVPEFRHLGHSIKPFFQREQSFVKSGIGKIVRREHFPHTYYYYGQIKKMRRRESKRDRK